MIKITSHVEIVSRTSNSVTVKSPTGAVQTFSYDKDHETICLYIPTDCLGARKRAVKSGKGI